MLHFKLLSLIPNPNSQDSIVNNGPLSSIRIEICALNGEFGSGNMGNDWTTEEFNSSIVRGREGRGPLLNGDRIVTLRNGVAYIPRILFTDNSRSSNVVSPV